MFGFHDHFAIYGVTLPWLLTIEGDDDGGGGGGGGDGGDGGDKDPKAEAGLMNQGGEQEGGEEGDKDSDKTLEFKGEKDAVETLVVPVKWVGDDGEINHPAILKSALDAGKIVREAKQWVVDAKKELAEGKSIGLDDKGVPKDTADYLTNSADDAEKPFIKDGMVQLGDDPKTLKPVPIDDPVIALFADIAKDEGMSRERFERIVSRVLVGVDAAAPEAVAPIDLEAEGAKFGPAAKAVASTNKTWADNMLEAGKISAAEHVHLLNMGKTAVGLSVVNKLRIDGGGKTIPLGADGVVGELPSKEEWYRKKPDHRLDPTAYEKWQEQGKELFGENAAGSSERGLGVVANQSGAQSSYAGEGNRKGSTMGTRGTRR